MTDQFPATRKTVVMTAPAILEWLEGEAEDVRNMKTQHKDGLQHLVLEGMAIHLEGMAARFAETTMRGLDGDTTAARPNPKGKP